MRVRPAALIFWATGMKSLSPPMVGLSSPKLTFRQRNLYCLFDLDALPEDELAKLEARATALGDYILAGHLLRDVDGRWGK
ncbi:hypothetical protein JYK21_23530 [Ralstonia pickettii]|nr:hypothetical protein [Ralstonia pickettii]